MVPGKKASKKSKTWVKKTSKNYSAPFFLGAFAPPSELFCATKSFSASAAVGTCYLGITFLKPRFVDRLVFKIQARLRHEFRASLDMNVNQVFLVYQRERIAQQETYSDYSDCIHVARQGCSCGCECSDPEFSLTRKCWRVGAPRRALQA